MGKPGVRREWRSTEILRGRNSGWCAESCSSCIHFHSWASSSPNPKSCRYYCPDSSANTDQYPSARRLPARFPCLVESLREHSKWGNSRINGPCAQTSLKKTLSS